MITLGPREERALILTCPGLVRSVDQQQLASGGVNSLQLSRIDQLQPALTEGAGLLIVEASSRQAEELRELEQGTCAPARLVRCGGDRTDIRPILV